MITVGSRVRWILPFIYVQNSGIPQGYEGTVINLSSPEDRAYRLARIRYDDGTESDVYVCHLQEIADNLMQTVVA